MRARPLDPLPPLVPPAPLAPPLLLDFGTTAFDGIELMSGTVYSDAMAQ